MSSFLGSSWQGREKRPRAGEGQEKGTVGKGTSLASPGHLWGTEWPLWEQREVIALSLWGMLGFRSFHAFACWNFPAQGLWLPGQHKDCSLCGAQIWGLALLVQMNSTQSPEFPAEFPLEQPPSASWSMDIPMQSCLLNTSCGRNQQSFQGSSAGAGQGQVHVPQNLLFVTLIPQPPHVPGGTWQSSLEFSCLHPPSSGSR